MPDFLLSHKLDQEAVLRGQASSHEIIYRESGKPVLEEIELYPFLVQSKGLVKSG